MNNDHFDMCTELNPVFRRTSSSQKAAGLVTFPRELLLWVQRMPHSYQQRQLRASLKLVARIKTADAHLILDIWSVVELLQVAKANDFYLGSRAWCTAYIQEIASKRPGFPGSVGGKREIDKRKKKKNETLKVR